MIDVAEYKKILETAEREAGDSGVLPIERWRELKDRAVEALGDRPDMIEALAAYYPGEDTSE